MTTTLLSPARLEQVRRSNLLDTGPEEPFDRLTRLACELLGAPFGFVTVGDERRSFWKSCIGVAATELSERQNPVGESFCQYVIAADDAVIIEDARQHPMTYDNPSIESMGVIAWAGFPVRAPDGQVLGSFCVVDSRPRQWSEQDRRTLEVLAHAAGGEVALRIAVDEAARTAARYQQVARSLREALAPRRLPRIDGLDVAVEQFGGDEVLGGFYDGVRTPTGWAMFLGGAQGHDVPAARISALAKHNLRAGAERASSPGLVISDLHAVLCREAEQTGEVQPVDVAYAALRRVDDHFAARICAAGATAVFLRRGDGAVSRYAASSGPLGTPARVALRIDDLTLSAGDALLLLSGAGLEDGVPFGGGAARDVLAELAGAVADGVAALVVVAR